MSKFMIYVLTVLFIQCTISIDGAKLPTCDDIYSCDSGVNPLPNPEHTPSASGCGSYGLSIFERYPEVTRCCDVHDICYDTCLTKRTVCDAQLKTCIKQIEDEGLVDLADELAYMVHLAVDVFGCKAFHNSQEIACICK